MSFQAYLHTISVNIVRNYLKSRLNRENHLNDSSRLKNDLTVERASQEPFNTDSTDKTDAKFFNEFIVDTLRKKYHSRKIERDILVFKLFYFEGFSSKELYDKFDFDLSSSGIETLVSRMKAVLKDIEA